MKTISGSQHESMGLFSRLPGEDIFHFNERAMSVIGRESLSAAEFADLFHPEDKAGFSKHIQNLLEKGMPFSGLFRVLLYGECVQILCSAENKNGFVYGAIGLAGQEDDDGYLPVNESMSGEELKMSYLMARRNAVAKSTYIADMSHEIRTPMNAILGLSALLENTPLTEKQAEYNTRIGEAARALFRTVNNIMDFSKMEIGKLSLNKVTFKLDDILMDIATDTNTKAAEKGLAYTLNNRLSETGELIGDPIRLNQVLTNLLDNAVQFTNSGSIELTVEAAEEQSNARMLRFTVSDTGVGMSASQVSRLFDHVDEGGDPVNRKYGGSGISLIICKNLIELMQGEIWCESKVDEGTVFYFTVLLDKAVDPEKGQLLQSNIDEDMEERYDDSDPTQNAKVKILVAEDISINQTIIDEILKNKGYAPEFASNGEEAMDMVQKGRYDLVFMDIRMPVMDGLTATREIRKDACFNNLPIIAMTAHATVDDREKGLNAGMNSYITKPIEAEIVYRALRCWLR